MSIISSRSKNISIGPSTIYTLCEIFLVLVNHEIDKYLKFLLFPQNLDIFQYKHSMKMTDIGLTEQLDFSLKFEIWFRKRKPSDTYILQATNGEMKEAWTEEISKLLWRQALKNRTLRLHEMSSMGIGNKPCLDIRPSEDQINDRSVAVSSKQG